jgi:post-segregation antitoxin (ccd killing protein)
MREKNDINMSKIQKVAIETSEKKSKMHRIVIPKRAQSSTVAQYDSTSASSESCSSLSLSDITSI